MATKTISLKLEAYEKLRAARRHSGESLSQVVMRARWPEETTTAADWLRLCRQRGPRISPEGLSRIGNASSRTGNPS